MVDMSILRLSVTFHAHCISQPSATFWGFIYTMGLVFGRDMKYARRSPDGWQWELGCVRKAWMNWRDWLAGAFSSAESYLPRASAITQY